MSIVWLIILANNIINSLKKFKNNNNNNNKESPSFLLNLYEKATGVLIYNFGFQITLAHLFYLLFFTFVNFINNSLDNAAGIISIFIGIFILFIGIFFFFLLI